ncbi:DNA recombination protein RecF [Roseivirga sp. 4D4]|uniref:DNA replication/repair protein RecF n=1 Tax=Roseivirga sp. 4D4 TaxID=1889784 RepID=UPI000852CE49|nr:DNA replication/repair protein RecF [Roseivirga sp. 4D4]OEK02800.1 DNA recombination protein RecF [Roseivirga sp. 4D4]
MHLESLRLSNFKNYPSAQLEFSREINCFLGKNGSGKTNLLDAIFYLSFTKSASQSQDQQCVLHDESFFSVRGNFELEEKSRTVICGLQLGKKKLVKLDDKPYKRASEHVGKFPVVLIAPNDTDVIRGTSEDRRKFFDAIISQVDGHYLQNLIQYNHALKQRNSLLKQFAERDFFDADQLQPFTEKLIELGSEIFKVREQFLKAFQKLVNGHYANLSEESEAIDLQYESHFFENIRELFAESLKKDLILKRTNIGIHKDDFPFLMNGKPIRKFGSQGQQKSYLIALKLANFDYLYDKKGIKPLLLLDDIFDKLDDFRITKLVEMVASETFGQIFVTDARPERTLSIFEEINQDVKLFSIDQGQVELLA